MPGRGGLNTLLVVVAAVPLLLTVVDFVLARGNQSLQAELARRQHQIAEGAQIAHANQLLVRQIAVTAVRDKNAQLRELLSRNGITIKITPKAGNGATE